ncbi:hypothetical protein G5O_0472 [Chlamydia psittaci 6BC]|nr:hypothetical protein G5O_0472 [Chlamydia psittaci 6BC]
MFLLKLFMKQNDLFQENNIAKKSKIEDKLRL